MHACYARSGGMTLCARGLVLLAKVVELQLGQPQACLLHLIQRPVQCRVGTLNS